MTLTQIGTADPASEVYFFRVHGGHDAEFDKIFRKPVVRAFSTLVTKKNQKVPIGVVLAGWSECAHEPVVRDAVDQHTLQPAVDDALLRDEPGDEADRAHLPHQRRV